jgi:zinc protease
LSLIAKQTHFMKTVAFKNRSINFIELALLMTTLLLACVPSSLIAQEKLITDRVFLVPDPKSTSIQFQMIVLAGSADETNMAQLGIAHYLEHLVLVGRNSGHAETAMKFFADGSSNGSTSGKMTSYIHRFPASAPDVPARLDKLFKFYSERLTDFTIDPNEAIRERNVVRQEHDWRYASSPTATVWKDVSAYLYRGHPFEKWTIGTPETIAAFTTDESRNFLRRWYRKSNVYFILTGPVAEPLVKETAERYLASLDGSPPPERSWITQKLDLKPESLTFRKADAQIANASVTIQKFVAFDVADPVKARATRIVLGAYLGSKLTGSPHSVLVEGDAPVASALNGAGVELQTEGAISWVLGSVPEEGRSIDEQVSAIRAYMTALVARGIDAPTVERLKKRFARDYQRSLDEPQNTPGRLIGWLTQPMPYEAMASLPGLVASVSAEDVNAMLKALTGEGREAVVIFEPATKP